MKSLSTLIKSLLFNLKLLMIKKNLSGSPQFDFPEHLSIDVDLA